MGLETDIQSPRWWFVEQALLPFFVVELTARLQRDGAYFFIDGDDWTWNWIRLREALTDAPAVGAQAVQLSDAGARARKGGRRCLHSSCDGRVAGTDGTCVCLAFASSPVRRSLSL